MPVQGVWLCLTCGRPSLRDCGEDYHTCGQREVYYCPLCETSRDFQYHGEVRDADHYRQIAARQAQIEHAVKGTPYAHVQPQGPQQPASLGSRAPAVVFEEASVVQGSCVRSAPPCSALPEGLPCPASSAELAAFLQQKYPTEEALRGLRAYLTGVVVPEIDKALHERSLCSVCLDRPRVVIALPCKHRCVCQACAEEVRAKQATPTCPLCRAKVADWLLPFD